MEESMRGSFKILTGSCIVAFGLLATSCLAAGNLMNNATGDEPQEQSWNREQTASAKIDARAYIQQRAQARAQQRQDRIAAMNWYGMSNSRPNAATTPFTSRYSSVWEMPGGRPYSWTPAWSRPNYILAWPY
jgi:hypothetical protein